MSVFVRTSDSTGVKPKWDTVNIPPEGHEDVARFAWDLFEKAASERERLGLIERWLNNHRLYRGDHWNLNRVARKKPGDLVTVNLLFANIIRTVANITARNPIAEVVDLDGNTDQSDVALSTKLKQWYTATEQGKTLSRSALNMETYGITVEKAIWNNKKKMPQSVVVDPYAFFPAPGYHENLNDESCPYVCHAYPMTIEEVKKKFGVDAEPEEFVSIMGEEREDNTPQPYGTRRGSANYSGNFSPTNHPNPAMKEFKQRRSLVVEVWVRDWSTVKKPIFKTGEFWNDDTQEFETAEMLVGEEEVPKYPGGIRLITVTNSGQKLLWDTPNPNVNPELDRESAEKTYLYKNFPFEYANSYEDSTSIWGFAAAEQVGPLNLKVDEIISRLVAYCRKALSPILIVPKGLGISEQKLSNQVNLVLMPHTPQLAQAIRYVPVPPLPSDFIRTLQFLIDFFDRVYQIEDADRGEAPKGVIAASAIVALQERGAVLIRHKIRAVDSIVRFRGRCAISMFQNFGTEQEIFEVQDNPVAIRGIDLAGRRFEFVVESGSTVARTSLQTAEDAKALFQMGAIDQQALLETLNFPDWKDIVERMAEGRLEEAMQILIQAGLPEDQAVMLLQALLQPQGGPGNREQNPPTEQRNAAGGAGTPRAMQGGPSKPPNPPAGVTGA